MNKEDIVKLFIVSYMPVQVGYNYLTVILHLLLSVYGRVVSIPPPFNLILLEAYIFCPLLIVHSITTFLYIFYIIIKR